MRNDYHSILDFYFLAYAAWMHLKIVKMHAIPKLSFPSYWADNSISYIPAQRENPIISGKIFCPQVKNEILLENINSNYYFVDVFLEPKI